MSDDFRKLVTALQSDYSLAIDFLDDPSCFLKNYQLNEVSRLLPERYQVRIQVFAQRLLQKLNERYRTV